MTAQMIYNHAHYRGISLEATCEGIGLSKWEKYMEGTTKANGEEIRRLIKKYQPDLYEDLALEFYNPYESQARKKPGLLIYVHSGIEYFLRINN